MLLLWCMQHCVKHSDRLVEVLTAVIGTVDGQNWQSLTIQIYTLKKVKRGVVATLVKELCMAGGIVGLAANRVKLVCMKCEFVPKR